MNKPLADYLWQAYRRDVLHESDKVELPELTQETLAGAEAELARIDALRLGASLASRDFAAYQNRKALVALLEAKDAAR